MTHDFLRLIQESKRLVESPLLDESALTTEKDPSLPIDFWVRSLNYGQQFFQNIVIGVFEDWLGKKETVTFTSGTAEYTLPTNMIKLRLLERTDLDPAKKMYPLLLGDKFLYRETTGTWNAYNTKEWYYFWHNKIGIVPTPISSSATAQYWYIRRMPDLSYGTTTTHSANTITLAATPTFGETANEDDYYNGCRIKIVSGTGVGSIQTVSDYDGSTRQCTMEANWGTTPSGTIIYSILSDIPEEHILALPYHAAISAAIKDKDQQSQNQLTARYTELKEQMINSMEQREIQETKMVHYVQDEYYNW